MKKEIWRTQVRCNKNSPIEDEIFKKIMGRDTIQYPSINQYILSAIKSFQDDTDTTAKDNSTYKTIEDSLRELKDITLTIQQELHETGCSVAIEKPEQVIKESEDSNSTMPLDTSVIDFLGDLDTINDEID